MSQESWGDVTKFALRGLLSSKKVWTAAAGMLATVAVRYLNLSPEVAHEVSLQVLGIVGILLVGQGLTDAGREASVAKSDGAVAALVAKAELALGKGDSDEDDDDA